MKPHLSIGQSDFSRIRQDGQYYIDKTLFIKEVIDASTVVLVTRPRRFGKTLNMTTLRYFYDNAKDYTGLFEGLNIVRQGEQYMSKCGQHPVLFMSFKDVKNNNWKGAYKNLQINIMEGTGLFYKDYPNIRSQLNPQEQQVLDRFFEGKPEPDDFEHLLKYLCHALQLHHGSPAVVLIDEYDTPLISAWLDGYYEECITFLRSFLSGLKDNVWLEKAVLTGIIRVAKESLFSGLNNLDIWSVMNNNAGDKFGFTEPEVQQLLADCGLNGSEMDNIRRWYNGYLFGNQEIYNPWSVLLNIAHLEDGFRAHWVNTSDNRLLQNLLFDGEASVREDIDRLMAKEWLEKKVADHLVFKQLKSSKDAVWNMLLAAGYLKCRNIRYDYVSAKYHLELALPNEEVRHVFANSIDGWLSEQVNEDRFDDMLNYLVGGDLEGFKALLFDFLHRVASYHDTAAPNTENFYHALFLGMLVRIANRYEIRSNRESGKGRYDIALFPRNPALHKAVVLEIKSPSKAEKETLRKALNAAVRQIKAKNYAADFRARGAQGVLQYALAVQGKEFLVKVVEEEISG